MCSGGAQQRSLDSALVTGPAVGTPQEDPACGPAAARDRFHVQGQSTRLEVLNSGFAEPGGQSQVCVLTAHGSFELPGDTKDLRFVSTVRLHFTVIPSC